MYKRKTLQFKVKIYSCMQSVPWCIIYGFLKIYIAGIIYCAKQMIFDNTEKTLKLSIDWLYEITDAFKQQPSTQAGKATLF